MCTHVHTYAHIHAHTLKYFHLKLQERKFFSVREHTPIIIAEAGDCGCTLARFLCRDTANAHESRQLATHMPSWVEDIVGKVRLI